MKENGGERLFETIGRIPETIVLEACRDQLWGDLDLEEGQVDSSKIQDTQDQDPYTTEYNGQSSTYGESAAENSHKKNDKTIKEKSGVHRLGDYLKYLPVAVCFCMVFGGAYYVVNNFHYGGAGDKFSMMDSGESGKAEDLKLDNENAAAGQEKGEAVDDAGRQEAENQPEFQLPLRFDAYEGPVIAMTATGDTQSIKTTRNLKGEVTKEKGGTDQPLLNIKDIYKIKNTSKEDKTLQLVYPFTSTMNLAYQLDGEILKVQGQKQAVIQYGIGGSISAYRQQTAGVSGAVGGSLESAAQDMIWTSSMEDYQQLFQHDSDYQKNALSKEADWESQVSVYTFTDIQMQEDSVQRTSPAVVGVTVYGTDAKVLTCGFSHSFEKEQGVANHCFFAADNHSRIMLIVTGQQEREPALGYYSNLDCLEEIEGIQCTMQKQTMSYSDALKLCAAAIARQTVQNYEQNMYTGELPEYFDAEAVYQTLIRNSGEEDFFDTITSRYQSTEIRDICEKIFGETRLIYAMTTVTIPAKKTLKVTARTQKRQNSEYYTLIEETEEETENYEYDFLSSDKSLLNIGQTLLSLSMPKKWNIAESSLEWKHKKSVWKTELEEESYQITISP